MLYYVNLMIVDNNDIIIIKSVHDVLLAVSYHL